jgi:hypothetical protein
MFECRNLAGRSIRSLRVYETGPEGPEVSIDFEDGTNFSLTLATEHKLDCRLTRDEGGEPTLLDKYEVPAPTPVDRAPVPIDGLRK